MLAMPLHLSLCFKLSSLFLTVILCPGFSSADAGGVTKSEFIYETAPFPSCHASTIVESDGKLVAAWFGGTREKHRDVCIWLARRGEAAWSPPEKVADGIQPDGKYHPCWNPVLFQPRGKAPLLLFYKVGPSPDDWWGMMKTSPDHGKTWSEARRLPDGILGPIKNKPVQLANGRILCGSSTEDKGWRVHFEWTDDLGKSWKRCAAINEGKTDGAIQPALLQGKGLVALCRSDDGGEILATQAADATGESWSGLSPLALPNPNSGIDAVTLRDGRHLLIYNHTAKARTPLNLAVSKDAVHWEAALVLESEPGEYSYPAIIQSADGLVHITYTWQRKRIRHVVVDPKKLVTKPIENGRWPE